jgi:hypothetical protein
MVVLCLQGNKVSVVGDTRILWVGGDYGPGSTVQFQNNRIVTSKVTCSLPTFIINSGFYKIILCTLAMKCHSLTHSLSLTHYSFTDTQSLIRSLVDSLDPTHSTVLHFTLLHFTSLHFTSLHFTLLHFTSLRSLNRT